MIVRDFTVLLAALTLLTACGGDRSNESAGANKPAEPAEPAQPTEPAEPSVTDRALDGLQRKYDELTGDNDPVQWASDDIENIGDWEYKVVDLSAMPILEWEATLNELGDERWEVIWIDATGSDRVAILKRPSVSLISKIPLSQLGRLLIGLGGGEAEP